jgi:FkbM family methyltransferase
MRYLSKIRKRTLHLGEPENHTTQFAPASSGDSMIPFIEWIKTYSSLRPKNVFEIGANMGQDAEALRAGFGIKPNKVWVFEPHPDLFSCITKKYRFNSYSVAASNYNGQITINLIDPKVNSNTGISSVRTHKSIPREHFKRTKVKCMRMDNFIKTHKIKSIDFLKLDVEGANYEVLEGFGSELGQVKSIHIEAEHHESWEGEKLWYDIKSLLDPHFEMVYFQRYYTQSDSFWVKSKYLSTHE